MHKQLFSRAFTIVELLVVIVVIGILATVVFVAFSGASQRAITASLQADLNGGKKQIEAYYATNGLYPTANNCTNTLTTEVCLKPSGGNTFTYTTFSLNGQTTYSLTATRGTISNTVTGGITPSIVTDGLVLNLDAGNPASYPGTGTTWTDLSGNGNNGTLVNGVGYSSDNGGSLVYDGVNDVVDVTVTKSLSFTTEFWARSTSTNINSMLFNAGPVGSGPDLFFSGGKISWNTWNSTSNAFGSIPSNFIGYHHFILLNDSTSTTKLYYDGSLFGIAVFRAANSTDIFTIGKAGSGGGDSGYPWKGNIAIARIYNKILTNEEILQNFNAVRSRFGI